MLNNANVIIQGLALWSLFIAFYRYVRGRTLLFNMKHGGGGGSPKACTTFTRHRYCLSLPACPSTAPCNCLEENFKVPLGRPKGLEEMWRDLRLCGWRWWSLGRPGQGHSVADSEQLGDFDTKNSFAYPTDSKMIFILFLSLPCCRCCSVFLETLFQYLLDLQYEFS